MGAPESPASSRNMSSERDPNEPPDGPDDDDFTTSGIYPRPRLNAARGLDPEKIERLRAMIARGELPVDAAAIARRLLENGWFQD